MTRSELTQYLLTMSSGTIAKAIGSTSYRMIDRAITSAILYAYEQASEDEIKACNELDDIIQFINKHKDYSPTWLE